MSLGGAGTGSEPGAPPPLRLRLRALGSAVLPGLLAGTHLTALVVFLNPAVPLTPAVMLRGIAAYGGLLGLLGAVLQGRRAWRDPRRCERFLPWTTTVALVLAAVAFAVHASRFAYYLPNGVNIRLVKGSALLAVAALVTFYTALLHTVMRRPYGIRSRVGLALLALATVYAAMERRAAFRPPSEPGPRASAIAPADLPPLLVVGVEAATLDAVLPLARQGRLPFLAGLLERGAYGRVRTLAPTRREAVWTTLATGKYPFRHGVKGAWVWRRSWIAPGRTLFLLPEGIGFGRWGLVGPAERLGPDVRSSWTVWEILARLGVRVAVEAWPVPPRAGGLRGVPAPSLPRGAGVSDAQALAVDDAVLARAHRALRDRPRALFVYLPGLAGVARAAFGGYDAVQFSGSQRPPDLAAAERVAGYYAALDDRLGRLTAAFEGGYVFVVSAGGARAGSGGLPGQGRREGGRLDGAPDGMLAMAGPGVSPARLLTGVDLVDVVPTLLYALGLPGSRDLDGRLLTAAFEEETLAGRAFTVVPSYENLAAAPVSAP